jgi:hypothetical protein
MHITPLEQIEYQLEFSESLLIHALASDTPNPEKIRDIKGYLAELKIKLAAK